SLRHPHDAPLLQEVHEPPGPGEADLELALQHRRRAELGADDQLHRLAEQLLVLVALRALGTLRRLADDALDVVDVGSLAAAPADDRLDLPLGYPGALDPAGPRCRRMLVEE